MTMGRSADNPAVGLYRYDPGTDKYEQIAVCRLNDERTVVCEGETGLCQNLREKGVWLKGKGVLLPTDGEAFLEALRTTLNDPHLQAVWL